MTQLAQQCRRLEVEFDQFLDLVTEQKQPESLASQLATEPPQRLEEVIGLDLTDREIQLLETLFSIEQGLGESGMELTRRVGALEIPKERKESVLRVVGSQVLELLQE
jgi:hypothetical protein